MSNPWGMKLKKTGLIEKLLKEDQTNANKLEQRQLELKDISLNNLLKINEYKERQSSLETDSMAGQQKKI
jgi:hypothetical protein